MVDSRLLFTLLITSVCSLYMLGSRLNSMLVIVDIGLTKSTFSGRLICTHVSLHINANDEIIYGLRVRSNQQSYNG